MLLTILYYIISNYIIDDINISSDDSDRENSDYSDGENSQEYVRFARQYKKFE